VSRRSRHPREAEQDVQRITDARRPHSVDQHDRIVKYTVSMSIRAVCIVLAFVVPGPLRWVFIAGAVVLPYVAVVIANAGHEAAPTPPETWHLSVERPALGPADSQPVQTPPVDDRNPSRDDSTQA
jgi:hypothetical protein